MSKRAPVSALQEIGWALPGEGVVQCVYVSALCSRFYFSVLTYKASGLLDVL